MSETILETIQTLRHRAERLEQEAAELRQALDQVAQVLESPTSVVARYVIANETYEITQSDVDAVKSECARPWTDSALYELAVVKKVANKLRERPTEAQNEYLFKTVEAIRAAAIADGSALDTEEEAVIGE
jgi:hypothetical protein